MNKNEQDLINNKIDLVDFLDNQDMYNKDIYHKEHIDEEKYRELGKKAAAFNNKLYLKEKQNFLSNNKRHEMDLLQNMGKIINPDDLDFMSYDDPSLYEDEEVIHYDN